MSARIQLAQINPSLGDVHGNLELHRAEIEAALAGGADVLLFPELSLTGYFLKDQTYDLALERDAPLLGQLASLSAEVSLGVGFVERSHDGRYYNAYAFFEGGRLVHVHRKAHLVSYGMFEESRDFAAGERFETFESRHGRFGILICEDLWHASSAYLHFLQGADAILVPSAGPARGVSAGQEGFGSTRTWHRLLAATSLFTQTWVVHVNRVGFEDGIGFGGQSSAHSPRGECVLELPALEVARDGFDLDLDEVRRARIEAPLLRDEKPWVLVSELARIRPDLFRLPAPPPDPESGPG